MGVKTRTNGIKREENIAAGKISRKKAEDRNALLKSMTDEVAGLVLMDNYRQNQAISLMERMSVKRLGSKQHFIRTLERQGLLDTRSDKEAARDAIRKSRGLVGDARTELAALRRLRDEVDQALRHSRSA